MWTDCRGAAPWAQLPSERIPAEIAPANLVLFGRAHDYRECPGDLPCIAGRTYDGAAHLIPLFDLRRHDLEALARRLEGYNCFYPIPGEWLTDLPAGLLATTNRDDSDYLYEADAMRSLAGRGRGHRRALADRFEQRHAPQAVDFDAGSASAALAVLDGWLADVGKSAQETDWEQARSAIHEMQGLGLRGRVVSTAAGVPAGFAIVSVHDVCAIVHFAKGRRTFEGLYPWLFRDLACRFPELRWLNFEQDLGNPGFRRNKLAFVPDMLIAKYRVSLA